MTGTRPGPDLRRVWDILRQHPRSLAVVAMGVLATAAFSPWVFCGAIAPWDFLGVSATAPVFTAQSIAAGNWPTWTSFVAGVLPMTSDTGGELFFPLWWIAGLVDLDLTVNTLAHIQVLFVFGGALGYVALLRARSIDWRWALLAGTAFTFFGGNFAEASHSGAVRGFALVPWVLWSLTIPPRGRPWLRFAVLPAWMWFLATGAYPAFVPTMAMLGAAYLASRTVPAPRSHHPPSRGHVRRHGNGHCADRLRRLVGLPETRCPRPAVSPEPADDAQPGTDLTLSAGRLRPLP